MSAARGFKLHSIIEKLSGQCGHDEESASAPPQLTGEDVSVNRRKQRKRTEVKKTRKDFHEDSHSNNSLANDDTGGHTPETLASFRTASEPQDSSQRDSHKKNLPWHGSLYFRQASQTKQKAPAQKKPRIKPSKWRRKKAQSTQTIISSMSTNQDLCVPQLEGDDVLCCVGKPTREAPPPPAQPKLLKCHICIAKFEDQKELDSHLEEDHQVDESDSSDDADESSEEELSEPEFEEVSTDDSDPTYEEKGDEGDEGDDEVVQDTTKTIRLTRNLRKSLLERKQNDQSPDNDLCIDLESVMNMATGLDDIESAPKPPRPRPCGKCNKIMESTASLKLHREENPECASHHAAALAKKRAKPKKELVCRSCGKTFHWKKDIENHFVTRKACQESLKCPQCGRQTTRYSSFQEHMLTHSEKLHKCEECDASFTHKSYLARHRHIHNDVKRFSCNECNKQFTYKASLQAHKWTHTGQKPFKCEYCEMRFTSSSSMKMHAKKHTGDLPFKCDVCGRGFAKNYGLRMHLTSHSDQKPFVCEICGKGFKRNDHLRLHKVIHSENKPYQCDTCQKTFNQYVCLKRHLPCRELERKQKRSKIPSEPDKVEEKGAANKSTPGRPSRRKKGVEAKKALANVKNSDSGKRKNESHNVKTLAKQSDILSADSAESEIPKAQSRSIKQVPATDQVKLSAATPRNEHSEGTDTELTNSSLAPRDTQHLPTGSVNTVGNTRSNILDTSGVQLFYPFNTNPNSVAPSLLFPAADAFSADALAKEGYSEPGFSTRVPDVSDELGSVLSSMDPDHLTALIEQTSSLFAPIQS